MVCGYLFSLGAAICHICLLGVAVPPSRGTERAEAVKQKLLPDTRSGMIELTQAWSSPAKPRHREGRGGKTKTAAGHEVRNDRIDEGVEQSRRAEV